jgi:hypothetical protein
VSCCPELRPAAFGDPGQDVNTGTVDRESPIATGGDDFSVCRTLPGDAHSARELFSWPNTSGTGAAYLSVFGADGIR